MPLYKFAQVGTRWCILFNGGSTGDNFGGIVSLSGTTTTISISTSLLGSSLADAIVVGSNKVLVLNASSSSNANILTDTAGTASAGTVITLSGQSARACIYAGGTDVFVQDGATTYSVQKVDCSGASPVTSRALVNNYSNVEQPIFNTSNRVLIRASTAVYGTAYSRTISCSPITTNFDAEIKNGIFYKRVHVPLPGDRSNPVLGKTDSERWLYNNVNVFTKIECVP